MVTPTAFQLLVAGRCKELNLYISCPRKKLQPLPLLTGQTKAGASWSVQLHFCRVTEGYVLAFQWSVRRVHREEMRCVTLVQMREVRGGPVPPLPAPLFPAK